VKTPLLSVRHLTIAFPDQGRLNYAVQDLNYDVYPGEVLGIVGESGCGKSISSLAILGILPSNAKVISGSIVFEGKDLLRMSPEAKRQLRIKKLGMIFQNPMTSLNPYLNIGTQLIEPLLLRKEMSKKVALKVAEIMLERVHIPEAARRLTQFPHEMSGGMCQRIMIAMALINKPRLLVADEPTTALDVTIQSQILSLLSELMQDKQGQEDMAMVLISHDIGVIANMSDRVMVMYAGSLMELAETKALLGNPEHPYTAALLASIPDLYGPVGELSSIPGNPPSLNQPHEACPFAPRCPNVETSCRKTYPPVTEQETRAYRCFYPMHVKKKPNDLLKNLHRPSWVEAG
jgi:oligopeptide/dipeptide ABC transporter ATP-binding protein